MRDEDVEQERKGADAGLNPMFGDWQQRFAFAPVPHADGGNKRAQFQERVRTELRNKFFYSKEVRVEITLNLDVQTVLETSDTADLDNYAKSILDALKGPAGILFDDTQVQTLIISWLDSHGQDRESFLVEINSGADEFMLKPADFYEMPDGLWYPQSRNLWSRGQVVASDRDHYAGLMITEAMSAIKANARHAFRRAGMDRLRAYQRGIYVSSSSLRGYHKSRIDNGFATHTRKSWQADFEKWKEEHHADATECERLLAGLKDAYAPAVGSLTIRPGA